MARRSSMLSPNPALQRGFESAGTGTGVMTLTGTVQKTALLLAVLVASATAAWMLGFSYSVALPAILVGVVMAFVVAFKPHLAKPLGLVYAVLVGGAVGAISNAYAQAYGSNIVLSAAALTMGILAALLLVYSTGLIKPSQNFKLGVMAATGGIFIFYLATIGLGLFGIEMPLVYSNSGWGIAFSVFVVLLASANLVLDFDFIEEGVERRLPAHMEWFGAFGLLVTLVWLYLEILRLLAKLQSRD